MVATNGWGATVPIIAAQITNVMAYLVMAYLENLAVVMFVVCIKFAWLGQCNSVR